MTRTTTEPPAGTWSLLGPPPSRGERLARTAALTWTLSRKNFQVRYKRAALGVLWAVVQPAFQAAVLTLVFVKVFRAGSGIPHYPAFVLSGMLPWTFFAQSLSVATVSVVENSSLVRKVAVPLQVFPWSAVGGTALAFLAALPVLLVTGLVVGGLGWATLLLPLALVLQALSVVGLAALASSLYPAFRDVRYLVESALMVGLYLTPVLYPPEKLPETASRLLLLNPLTGVLDAYRAAFVGRSLDWAAVGTSALVSLGLLAVGLAVFRARADEFADLV